MNGFITLFMLFIFVQCGQKKQADEVEENTEEQIEFGKKLGNKIYAEILSKDSLKIEKWFSPDIKNEISAFIEVIEAREEEWGEFHSFIVSDVTIDHVYLSGGDTVTYEIKVNAVYDYNETWDDLTLQKINKGEFKIIGYDFDHESMLNCAIAEIELLTPDYMDYSWSIFENDTNAILELCKQDKQYYDEIIKLQKEYFPEGSTCDSIIYNRGYIRKYCGLKGEANGMLIYTVYYNDTTYLDIMYKLEKAHGSEEYNMYSLYLTGDLIVDDDADVELAKSISKEVYKMVQKNDVEGFISTFHTQLRSQYTSKELKEMSSLVDEFKALGTFDDYHIYHTFRTADDDFTYYIVILDLINEEGAHSYLEMVFKPDTNGKFMMRTINEMLD